MKLLKPGINTNLKKKTRKEICDSIRDNLRYQLKSQLDTFIKNYYNVRTGSKSE